MPTSSPTPRIAIVGAGPAGLTLSALLRTRSIPHSIYELSPTLSSAGGTLDLHPTAGQAALRAAGLWPAFVAHARPESDVMKIVSPSGRVLWDENAGGADWRPAPETEEGKFGGRPEIDRARLLDILLAGAGGAGAVVWDKKLVALTTHPQTRKHTLHFADGTVEGGCDLVIGADGAWSKVRNALTDGKAEYSGISMLELTSLAAGSQSPWLDAYVGAGSCFIFDRDRAIQAQRLGDGAIRTYASIRIPESAFSADWAAKLAASTTEYEIKEVVATYTEAYFSNVHEDLKRVLSESTDQVVPRSLYQLPPGFRWEAKQGVALLGDAAHLMTPFAGVGVNAAMLDALELANAIAGVVSAEVGEGGEEGLEGRLARAMRGYEEEMFVRGEKYARKTLSNLEGHFREGGGEEFAALLRKHKGAK